VGQKEVFQLGFALMRDKTNHRAGFGAYQGKSYQAIGKLLLREALTPK
jgi:membrane-bound lytic murein transglycosylase